ncbi:aquaporin NIP [Kineococcus xinjiangensis]|uniref:Aquaporin NIP n=1 Tax=Kineococcus xinjiangensis TaxID=512762 RepID=A0A2S6IW91_9ACTN|nr:aquaporin NIP [Kineococcus xinjiangensis]
MGSRHADRLAVHGATSSRGLYGSTPGRHVARAGAAELVGTFVLVLAGTATAMGWLVGQAPGYDLLAVVLAFGLALTALAAGLGHVSGCHLNPAVTLGLASAGRFPWKAVPVYLGAQLVGAVLASLAVWAMYGPAAREDAGLAVTLPAEGVSDVRALLVEALITFVLVLVVMSVATDDRAPAAIAPVAAGAALAVCIFVAAPITGGAVNPARAFGPAVVAGNLTSLWVYFAGPILGGVLAALLYGKVFARTEAPS